MRMRSTTLRWVLCLPLLALGPRCGSTTDPGLTAAEIEARRDAIRAYFEAQRERRGVVATTVTDSGQVIDWIWPESQTPGGLLPATPLEPSEEEPPGATRPPSSDPPAIDPALMGPAETEVQRQPWARGPAGTVPIVRFDVERYFALVPVPPDDVRKLFPEHALPEPESNDRYYVSWKNEGVFYGTRGRINLWDTPGPFNANETSIAQTALVRPLTSGPHETLEAGKIEYEALNGDLAPHLFTFYRTLAGSYGNWVGGYNALFDGWVQIHPTIAPGMSFAGQSSTVDGYQYFLELQVRYVDKNWWVVVNGEPIGYYPHCVGGGYEPPCAQGTLFDTDGLVQKADVIYWYGEVYTDSAPYPTTTDMGSGLFAAEGPQRAASMSNIAYMWTEWKYWWWVQSPLRVTDPGCYTGDGPYFRAETPLWMNWFYFGGPGAEAGGCN